MRPWHRATSALAYVIGFGLIAVVLHEFFHFLMLHALGGEGYITFDWDLGLTHLTHFPNHLWAVQLSGGLLTGVFLLLLFWFWAWSSRTVHNTNMEVATLAWALGNVAYAPTELFLNSPALGTIAFGMGFSMAGALYFMKFTRWLAYSE